MRLNRSHISFFYTMIGKTFPFFNIPFVSGLIRFYLELQFAFIRYLFSIHSIKMNHFVKIIVRKNWSIFFFEKQPNQQIMIKGKKRSTAFDRLKRLEPKKKWDWDICWCWKKIEKAKRKQIFPNTFDKKIYNNRDKLKR